MDPHSRASKANTSHGNEVLLRLIQRPCYQRGSPCQNPAGNRTTRRPDHRKETQTAVVWTCLPFIRSGQNHLARHSERGKKTRQIEEEVGRQHQGMDRPGVRQVLECSGEQRKMEETGCEIICGDPTTLAVQGYVRWCKRERMYPLQPSGICHLLFQFRSALSNQQGIFHLREQIILHLMPVCMRHLCSYISTD